MQVLLSGMEPCMSVTNHPLLPSLPPCRALGCLDPQCSLCQHNPSRRCVVNFDRKYLVNDMLKARCNAPIRIELIDRNTGLPVEEEIPELRLEVGGSKREQAGKHACGFSHHKPPEQLLVADLVPLALLRRLSRRRRCTSSTETCTTISSSRAAAR